MIYTLLPTQSAIKLVDLKNTNGCWGLDLCVITFSGGNPCVFAIGPRAQDILNNSTPSNIIYNGFFLPDSNSILHRNFRKFTDELWARNLSLGPYQIDVQPYRIG